jgi:hypothetical protein
MFDWHRDDHRDTIVVPEQAAIAVYLNSDGHIVIRQQGIGSRRYTVDRAIVIGPLHARAVVNAITKFMGLEDQASSTPTKQLRLSTNAERQRRHREKLKHNTPTKDVGPSGECDRQSNAECNDARNSDRNGERAPVTAVAPSILKDGSRPRAEVMTSNTAAVTAAGGITEELPTVLDRRGRPGATPSTHDIASMPGTERPLN